MKKFTLSIICLLIISLAGAQNIYHPWIISAGAGFADFHFINKPVVKQFQDANWMGKKAPSSLRVGRLVTPCFSVSASYTTVTLEPMKLNAIPLEMQITDEAFYRVGVHAEYGFANGKLLKDESIFDPYLFIGFGITSINEEMYNGIPMGFGINIWPVDYIGLNFQASYEYLFDFNDYAHYSLGLTARFGKMIDKDRDHITDRYDDCPEIWGLENLNGCPDYDHDGITDSLDSCPKEFGWPPTDGCPDFDKDTIPDKDDACPCEPGPKKYNGCPGPSTADTPEQEIIIPDTTGEKVDLSTKNQTSETPELQNQNETVEAVAPAVVTEPATLDEAIDPHLDNIHFEANSAAIKPSSYPSLDKIHEIMRTNPIQEFTIQGYTDSSGPGEYNLFLSENRARSIKNYFTKKGIDPDRLDARGYGEIQEKHLNLTEEARSKNRRVEIYMK